MCVSTEPHHHENALLALPHPESHGRTMKMLKHNPSKPPGSSLREGRSLSLMGSIGVSNRIYSAQYGVDRPNNNAGLLPEEQIRGSDNHYE
jgi:hypothetical protein